MSVDPAFNPFLAALTNAVQTTGTPSFDGRSLGRLSDFSGRDVDWGLWSFVLEAHVAVLREDAAQLMEEATTSESEPRLNDMTPDTKTLSKKIYIVLVTSVKGKASICSVASSATTASRLGAR